MGAGSLLAGLVAAALSRRCDAAATGIWQIPFTSQAAFSSSRLYEQSDAYGPDGPWHALAIMIGNVSTGSSVPYVGVWPTVQNETYLLSKKTGGDYSASEEVLRQDRVSFLPECDANGWFAGYNISAEEFFVPDTLSVARLLPFENTQFRAPILEVEDWKITLPTHGNPEGGRQVTYTPQGGVLGVRHMLTEMRRTGYAASESFSLHLGSVALNQTGSFVVGGYEQNRAIGAVGTFNVELYAYPMPIVFLRDVVLGVVEGGSPFNVTDASVWRGLGPDSEEAALATQTYGGKIDSAIVEPNAAVPGLYLPRGTCEAAAEFLPVYLDPNSGYYLWNTTDRDYDRIVNSPAYMGFVLNDNEARNITIRVMFKLLSLILEPPIVPTPVPYFPCHSSPAFEGFWSLGRAFLQATFFGVNFETNISFIAQAPGPNMDPSVLRTMLPDAVSIQSNLDDTFDDTWRGEWKTVTDGVFPTDPPTSTEADFTSTGAFKGIIIGLVVGALALPVCLFLLQRRWKKQRKASRGAAAAAAGKGSMSSTVELGGSERGGENELHEIGVSERYEMPSLTIPERYEAPTSPPAFEMPANECHLKTQASNS